MKISTKGRYGLKAMLDLAVHNTDGQVSLKSIADREGLSENYLEQLFAALKKAGIVKSIRGSQGGYTLAAKPDEISVGSILRALEGSLAPVECVSETNPSLCCRQENCITKGIWEKIRNSINDVIDSTTLENLVEDYHKQIKKDDYTFQI